MAEQGTRWSERANRILGKLLLKPPRLSLVAGEPLDWATGYGPHWESDPGGKIDNLSDAEKRWSRIAIALASHHLPLRNFHDLGISSAGATLTRPAPFLLLDEPERGLHRAAEAHLADGLLGLARTDEVRLIIATHSPTLLDAGQGQIVELKKRPNGGIGELAELTSAEIDELRSFGLQPSSLLYLDRGYLLVEGVHDKAILEGWFAEELKALRVSVLRDAWDTQPNERLRCRIIDRPHRGVTDAAARRHCC